MTTNKSGTGGLVKRQRHKALVTLLPPRYAPFQASLSRKREQLCLICHLKYQNYLPTWDPEQKYPPLQPFAHTDHGIEADPNYPELLRDGVKISHLTPSTGSEVRGIQLSTLTDAGKSELARLVAERKVVAFRDQDFAKLPIPDALKFGEFFGRHHIHPASGAPEGFPEIQIGRASCR